MILREAGGISRIDVSPFRVALTPEFARSRALGVRGPRTQPGLYRETHGERVYLRKRCTCPAGARGRGSKRLVQDIGDLPVTIRTDGTLQLLF